MPRYMEVAADANVVAKQLLELVPEGARPQAAAMIARLVNFGLRAAPRAVQSTVRFNAVHRAVQGMPVKLGMDQRTDERTGKKYNVLVVTPLGGEPVAEGAADDGE